jgi:hypothetical protein
MVQQSIKIILLWTLLAGISFVQTGESQSAQTEFNLKIVREEGLPQALNLGDCIPGTMYVGNADAPVTGARDVQIGATLELPWRFNQGNISAIPEGSYTGHVREDGDLGWRIELVQVKNRKNVEIHVGNWPKNSTGCILLGLSAKKQGCVISKSGDAMKQLRDFYGAPTNTRPIRITIVDQ